MNKNRKEIVGDKTACTYSHQKFAGDGLSFPFGFIDEGEPSAADLHFG